ncbi:hypothetical protein SLA_1886 [Streptomyces laurentii]|uniref:Uncharacterized protein n=1 Tax=Streptomyces laurentii TaxID=39478 RepID=A0A160NXC9_STRLU|nr:hypothetical protein SLA_1886 [Streptomyces laurentii]
MTRPRHSLRSGRPDCPDCPERLLTKIEELEPSVAVLPADMAALPATSSPVPIIPFDAPAQNPGGIQAWLDEQNSTAPGTATEDTEA